MQAGDGDVFVYFIECMGHVKIGVASDVGRRVKTLQIGSPFPLRAMERWWMPSRACALYVEDQLHEMFDAFNVGGEWFRFPGGNWHAHCSPLQRPLRKEGITSDGDD